MKIQATRQEEPQVASCPISGILYTKPCPVHSCIANATNERCGVDCLIEKGVGNFNTLCKTLGESPKKMRDKLATQTETLTTYLSDFQDVMNHHTSNACKRCGYIRPCPSETLCEERATMVKQVVKVTPEFEKMRITHIWWAVILNKASFLSTSSIEKLEDLISAKDIKEHRNV